ncbi:hypothetical protein SKAU_G00172810 [Synaphobranchus kaupii]|uniref:Agrin n=1 Tax=Synaphobranchus kaupii TaxID=118154 RepID=A0A9Q1FKX0_SYNKA|nr:hypothetical protein SKAU_G00172810 [Synaphobranchus kaupii]
MGIPILKRENAVSSSDVSTFPHHPCAQGVCKNGGHCHPQLEGYECVCRHGFSGTDCKNEIVEKSAGQTDSIAFDGRTFIEYHNAVSKSEKAMLGNRFELSIKTEATHGLILWSGKGMERSDYIALALVDGRVQMTYDLGSKPVVLRSSVRVNTNRWIRIKASRSLRDGSCRLVMRQQSTGSSPLGATQLDTDGALWLGGLERASVARRLPKAYSTGFIGCVKDVDCGRCGPPPGGGRLEQPQNTTLFRQIACRHPPQCTPCQLLTVCVLSHLKRYVPTEAYVQVWKGKCREESRQ